MDGVDSIALLSSLFEPHTPEIASLKAIEPTAIFQKSINELSQLPLRLTTSVMFMVFRVTMLMNVRIVFSILRMLS